MRMVALLAAHPEIDSVRSVSVSAETPFKMWYRDGGGLLHPVVTADIPDMWNLPRQLLPVTYSQNAAIDVVWSRVVLEQRSMTGRTIHGYVMEGNLDIDTEGDLERAAQRLADHTR